MELADYKITFVYIKDKNNVLLDAIPRWETLNIYKEPLENPHKKLWKKYVHWHAHHKYLYTPHRANVGQKVQETSITNTPW